MKELSAKDSGWPRTSARSTSAIKIKLPARINGIFRSYSFPSIQSL